MKQSLKEWLCGSVRKMACVVSALLFFYSVHAQTQPQTKRAPMDPLVNPNSSEAKPHNLKILDEHSDGKGYIVRTLQYDQGLMRVTETIFMPEKLKMGAKVAINPDTMRKDQVMIEVDKSHYCVQVFYRKRMIRVYKAVFGPHPQQDKLMEGDRCTPEGWFKITTKNPRSQYDKFMLLSYPTDSSIARFNKMKSRGVLPQNAKIGGSVGIHGIWPGGDDMIEMGVGWTDGCVALKNKDIEELYAMVGVGTRVYIKK